MPEEYLVFVEEDDDGPVDDRLVLKVGGRHRHLSDLEIQPEIDVQLVNRGGGLALTGLMMAIAGGVAVLGALAMFLLYYPDHWASAGVVHREAQYTGIVAVIGILLLAVGSILAPVGRRIQARGVLRSVRVVEKA